MSRPLAIKDLAHNMYVALHIVVRELEAGNLPPVSDEAMEALHEVMAEGDKHDFLRTAVYGK